MPASPESADSLILPFQKTFPKIASSAYLAPGVVVVGDVSIGAHSSVWFGCVVRGDVNYVRIGTETNIQDGSICHVTRKTHPLIIGDRVTVGHRAVLHGCTLQDECLIGMGAVILDGVIVEAGAMVAAGAVVPPGKVVRRGELWGGNPAKLMRPLKADEVKFLRVSADNYVKLAAHYTGS